MRNQIPFFKKAFGKMLLLGLSLTSLQVSAQKYLEIANKSTSKNFSEILKEVESYYQSQGMATKEDKEDEGSEYNQFQRWKYFNKFRLSNGQIQNSNKKTLDEIKNYTSIVKPATNSVVAANWTALGPTSDVINGGGYSNGLGRVNCVAIDPSNSSIVYIGAPSGGLWRSVNGGTTWAPLTDNYLATIGVSGIAIDPTSPVNNRTLYIFTGDGDGGSLYSIGVLKSTDNGTTWKPTGLSFSYNDFQRGYKLLIHPSNNQILFAATSAGIYKTIDGGSTWTLPYKNSTIYDIEFKPGNPAIMYASGSIMMRSVDGGSNWTGILSGLPSSPFTRKAIAVTAANPNYVYIIDGNIPDYGQFGGLYRSSDSGLNFTAMSNTPNILDGSTTGGGNGSQSWYDLALAVSPVNPEEVHVGGINCWKSIDGGVNWINTSFWIATVSAPDHYTHADIHALEFNNGILYCGSDGGIFKSTNSADTWSNISKGLNISQIYRIGVDQTNANRTICGAQDNGMNNLIGGVYNQWFGADGFEGFVDYVTPTTIYGEYQYGGLLRSTDNGQTVSGIVPPQAINGSWLTAFVMDPLDHNTIYSGFADIWKSTDMGNNWTNLTNGFKNSSNYEFIAVAPSNNQVIYANKNGLVRTKNGGKTWEDKAGAMINNAALSFLAVNPDNANEIWITTSGYTAGQKVFKSSNGGDSWTNVSGSIPNVPVNCIVVQRGTGGVYIGTDMGVFYKDNSLSDWVLFSTGLPRTIVSELEIYYPGNKLRAGTYGRGVWECDLAVISNNNLALHKSVFSSSNESGSLTPDMAVDGQLNTRWSSAFSDPQWIYVDLLKTYAVNRVKINWENAYGKDYKIQISSDTKNWSDIKVVSGNTVLTNDWVGLSGTGRYIRVLGTSRGTQYGYSIYELEVYGIASDIPPTVKITSPVNGSSFSAPATLSIDANASDIDGTITKVEFFQGSNKLGEDITYPYSFTWASAPAGKYILFAKATDNSGSVSAYDSVSIVVKNVAVNLALNKPAFSSSDESSLLPPNQAVDGNTNSRWSSAFSDPQWIYVDLLQAYAVNEVKITWEAAYARDYKVQISNDAIHWTDMKAVTGNSTLTNDWTSLAGAGRYVRIYGSARATQWGYSIFELEVYGTKINQALAVSISSPVDGTTFSVPSTVTITASATDSIYAVTKVEFFAGTTKIGEDNTAPYSISWKVEAGGSYILTAKATDNANISKVSSPISIMVFERYGSINLALNRPVFTSGNENGLLTAGNAVDANFNTRWSSAFNDQQWLYVDLGQSFNIKHLAIFWEAAYGKDYKIQLSSDASNWTDIISVVGNTTLNNFMSDQNGTYGAGRYVRILGSARATPWGYSIYEFQVYGNPVNGAATSRMSIAPNVTSEQKESGNNADLKLLNVYPNPVKNDFTLTYTSDKDQEVFISLSDMSGQELMTLAKIATTGLNSFEIQAHDFVNGIYILRLRIGAEFLTKKIIIAKE